MEVLDGEQNRWLFAELFIRGLFINMNKRSKMGIFSNKMTKTATICTFGEEKTWACIFLSLALSFIDCLN